MTRIKICGLTRIDDTIWANELLPDYIGFIFAISRRRIDAKDAVKIAERLNSNIKKVGVFVNPSIQYIDEVLSQCPLDILQFHGEETPEFCDKIKTPIIKAFRMKNKDTLDKIKNYDVDSLLFDGYHPSFHGGEGISFPWEWVKDLDTKNKEIFIAGGINIDNIKEVIKTVHPYAVDVSSSVETEDIKDKDKIERFMRKVREIDEN